MNKEINYDSIKYNDKDSAWGYFFIVLIPIVFQLLVTVALTLAGIILGTTATALLENVAVQCVFYLLNGLCLLVIFLVFNKVRKKKPMAAAKIDFNFGWKNCLLCVVVAMVVLFGFNHFVNLLSHVMSLMGYKPDASMPLPLNSVGDLFLNLFVLAVVPAICEELVYRGIILNGLRKFGVHTAVFSSAAIFAIAHGSAMQTIYQFILGVVLGYILIKTGSLVASIIVHFLNNAMVIIVNYIMAQPNSKLGAFLIEHLGETDSWPALKVVLAICMAMASVAIIILILRLIKPKKKELIYVKTDEKINRTALKVIIISAVISLVMWCVGTFVS